MEKITEKEKQEKGTLSEVIYQSRSQVVGHSYVLRRKTAGNMIPNANPMCIVRIAKIKG